MAEYLILPRLGQTMRQGTITKWLVKEGDTVSEGQEVFELESDKLANTETSPVGGVLKKILVPEGVEIPILTHVAIVAAKDEDISALLEESGAQTANGNDAKTAEVPVKEAEQTAAETIIPAAAGGRIVATPRAKIIAGKSGVDLSLVPGSGPGGRIRERDVEKYLASRHRTGDVEKVPMSGMRKAIAANMLRSVQTSPTVTFTVSVDMTNLQAFREQLKADGCKVSYTDLLVKFVSVALKDFPLLNSSVEGDNILYKKYINMGVAVALEEGLIVPNIKNADQKSLQEISGELKDLAQKARSGALTMDDYTGGTFTITNLGMYGIESFTPIINQPEVAILGVNAMIDRPVFEETPVLTLTRRTFLPLCLTADHRVVDGAVAAQFLKRLKDLLENPVLQEG